MSRPADSIPNLIDCVVDERYKLVKLLGAGTYGVVYKALDLQSPSMSHPHYHAIKILQKAGRTPREIADIRREVALHTVVSHHPNVVNLHDAYDDSDYFYIILDYHSGGDLFELVIEKGMYRDNDELIRSAFLSIIDAVQACHDAGIAHRDLKPENFLMSKDGSTAYLADFGLASKKRMIDDFGWGTDTYLAPECWGPDPYDTHASDVWALGPILTDMACCICPWDKASLKDDRYAQYVNDPNFFYKSMPISKGLNAILLRIFALNPLHRPTLPELRQMILSLDTFYRSPDKQACAPAEKCFEAPSIPHPQPPASISSNSSISSVPSMSSSDFSEGWEDESQYLPEETSSWTKSAWMDNLKGISAFDLKKIMAQMDNYLV